MNKLVIPSHLYLVQKGNVWTCLKPWLYYAVFLRSIAIYLEDCSFLMFNAMSRRPSKVHSYHFASHTSIKVIRPRLHHGETLG